MSDEYTTSMTHEDLGMTEDELRALRDKDPQQAAADDAPGDKPAVEGKQGDAAAPKQEDAAGAAAGTEDKPQGDVRAALRAARRGEHRARQEAERLRTENEELRSALPKPPVETVDDDLLAVVEADYPQAAKELKELRAKVAATPAPAAAPAPKPADFAPQTFDPEVQDDIDAVPDLLAWQMDPDQTAFEIAKAADRALLLNPLWKDKPQAQRFAEVARRVKADLAAAAPAPTQQKPKVNVDDAVRDAPVRRPSTLSDIAGGGDSPTSRSNLGRFAGMSNDEIEADLLSR